MEKEESTQVKVQNTKLDEKDSNEKLTPKVNIVDKAAAISINTNLDSLINKIKKEENTKSESALEWNLVNVQKVWNEYKEKTQSNSTKAALENVILEIQENSLLAKVPSELIKEKIIAEKGVQIDLRSNFHDDLSINYEVNLDLFPDYQTIPVKKILTDEEKYRIMLEKNPNLEKLVKNFDLGLDKR